MNETTFEIRTTCECEVVSGFFGVDETGHQPECGQEVVLTVREDDITLYKDDYDDCAVCPYTSVECPKCKNLLEWPQRWFVVEKEKKWSAAIMSNDNLPEDSLVGRLLKPKTSQIIGFPPRLDTKAPDYDVMCKLVEIFEDTERYDKVTITLDQVSRNVTIVYEDMDDEWFHELLTL